MDHIYNVLPSCLTLLWRDNCCYEGDLATTSNFERLARQHCECTIIERLPYPLFYAFDQIIHLATYNTDACLIYICVSTIPAHRDH